ncbi:MAG: TonB-dependent receptor, partial [Gammaproteobacteria bacterium]
EVAALTADRGTTRPGLFVPDEETRITTSTRTMSVYFTDTFAVTETLDLTVAGRYNATKVKVGDRNLLNYNPALNGEHDYERFNPAVGLTWQATETLNVYGSYSESSRAPTPVELSCASPDAPCSLPNAFLADPPLQQVVAESWEAGLRGQWQEIDWHLGGFWTTNKDDIIFQSTGGTTGNIGFFDNIGDTLRRGIELGLAGTSFDHLAWFLNYSFVDATFDDPFLSNSPNHPLADANGNIQVQGGDRIPGIPQHTLKIGGDYAFSDALSIGGDLNYNSDQYLRGDEANLLDTIDGYVVVNVHASYRFNEHVTILGRINNLFDTDYESFGLLGEPGEVFNGSGPGFTPAMSDPRFLGPGAPIGGWLGIKITL